jgi:hypothetical protein
MARAEGLALAGCVPRRSPSGRKRPARDPPRHRVRGGAGHLLLRRSRRRVLPRNRTRPLAPLRRKRRPGRDQLRPRGIRCFPATCHEGDEAPTEQFAGTRRRSRRRHGYRPQNIRGRCLLGRALRLAAARRPRARPARRGRRPSRRPRRGRGCFARPSARWPSLDSHSRCRTGTHLPRREPLTSTDRHRRPAPERGLRPRGRGESAQGGRGI